jgi:hypothetical protein
VVHSLAVIAPHAALTSVELDVHCSENDPLDDSFRL